MTYSYNYRNNPSFPYTKRKITKKPTIQQTPPPKEEEKSKEHKKEPSSFLDSSFIHTFLEPVEKLLGRKIGFDDILLVALIYILFTEKEGENDNKTLLLCLIFILLG